MSDVGSEPRDIPLRRLALLLAAWAAALVLLSVAGAIFQAQRTLGEPSVYASSGLCLLVLWLWTRPRGAVRPLPAGPVRPVPVGVSRKGTS